MQVTVKRKEKISVLFQGWTQIPHSYASVNCFQLIHLYNNYNKYIDIYIQEMPYFREHWNNAKKLVYGEKYNNILRNLKEFNGEYIDLVYSITYPYNINNSFDKLPKCVFYTSEFATLDTNYFEKLREQPIDDAFIKYYLKTHNEIYFTSPSVWSAKGMEKYLDNGNSRNRIITHGVDTELFKKNNNYNVRDKIRKFYKIKNTDILLLNIGAMTGNKGIVLILDSLNKLVNVENKKYYKLMLKGTGDLYQTKDMIENYFNVLINNNFITKKNMDILLSDHIIFTDKTLDYSTINDLFNASDVYISPYLAEGFNLVCLEALAAGLQILVPRTGSTKEYVSDIYNNGGSEFIHYIDSNVILFDDGKMQNNIQPETLLNTIKNNEYLFKKPKVNYLLMKEYIQKEYSWNKVSDLLFNYFTEILSS